MNDYVVFPPTLSEFPIGEASIHNPGSFHGLLPTLKQFVINNGKDTLCKPHVEGQAYGQGNCEWDDSLDDDWDIL